MSYTGEVRTGGPAAVRELAGLRISKLSVGPMDNNAYLLECTTTGDAALIDAANEADRLIDLVGDRNLVRIVTTHRHKDHWQALAALVQSTGATTSAHPLDGSELPVPVSATVEDGDTVAVGDVALTVIHLRGHTPGSIALHWDGGGAGGSHLFTGDSLFPGGPGNTFGDTEAFHSLMDDLESRVFGVLADDTWVYPGHGSDTTLGAERPSLAEWRTRGW